MSSFSTNDSELLTPADSNDESSFPQEPEGLLTPRSHNNSQPLVLGTPRTPRTPGTLGGTPNSTVSDRSPSHIPRGDVGRGYRVPSLLNAPSTPRTPTNWDDSPSSHARSGIDLSGNGRRSLYTDPEANADSHPISPPNVPIDLTQDISQPDAVLWGTTINVQSCLNIFRNFLENFTLETEFEPYYQRQLHIIHRTQNYFLNLNCSHLLAYPPSRRFYQQLKSYPQELIPVVDMAINAQYTQIFGEIEGNRSIQVRTYGLRETFRMRDLDPIHIDQLLCIKGMVIRCSPIIPDLKQAYFRCYLCNYVTEVTIDRGRIDEPTRCQNCTTAGSMEIIHNRSLFFDKQLIRLQETPDEVPEGETPYTVSIFAFDSLVDTVRPGDRIEITGIYRAIPRRSNPTMRTLKTIYRTYLDAIHFRRSNQNNSTMMSEGYGDESAAPSSATAMAADVAPHEEISTLDPHYTSIRRQEFQEFCNQGDVYNRLINSFAPSIWELEDVKKGILCQLFGGTSRRQQQNGNQNMSQEDEEMIERGHQKSGYQRSDINILLCGDPGTSKSQLLSYVHKITPRGIYTSGKGSSAVGLTASVIRDPETRDMVLESGALVLSDNGICCIDEFDKMTDTTRAILHEAMEQQTVSITKAGIIATLNARTSILASANPVESRYNPNLSVVENIKLPPTLLSRFDLIYLVLDKPNPDSDRRLAKHLVSLYHPEHTQGNQRANTVTQEFLKDYIYYCRHHIAPEISDEAVEALVEGYLSMRSLGGRGSKTITATPRQLESMIRISQALAKMRMSFHVTASDVYESIRLMKVATQTAATDPRTGTIDMDMITTGRSGIDRELVLKLADQLQELFNHHVGERLTLGQIRQFMSHESDIIIRTEDLIEAIREIISSENGNMTGGRLEGSSGSSNIQFMENTQTVLIRTGGR